MPPRKSHRKSRAGCQRCKSRKIKAACDFEDSLAVASPVAHLRRTSTNSSLVRASSASSPSSASVYADQALSPHPDVSRILEMRILHTYSTLTSKTLVPSTNDPATQETWQVMVPNIAFESPCLLDAILAVSALHLRCLNPEDYSLVRASHSYMASALSRYSSMLSKGVDSSNADALFVTSALVAFQASASRRFMKEDNDKNDGRNGYTLPIQWFHSFQGVKAIVMMGWQYLRQSNRVLPIIRAQPPVQFHANRQFPDFLKSLLDDMDESLQPMDEKSRDETRRSYEHSVAFLDWAHQKPVRGRVLGFPAIVSRRFVELIEQKDPRTLAITGYFFAMTRACDDVWWLDGVAKREVEGIMSFLPRSWWPKMDWALRVANTEGPLDEGVWRSTAVDVDEEDSAGVLDAHLEILGQMAALQEELG